ncbi:hypothetical protein C8J57DRAFT_1523619 [Mycena rebaudengoi]|nr:hypothetical protein C8J57DRAFT_1523619 [Mycena rebaudengoi]
MKIIQLTAFAPFIAAVLASPSVLQRSAALELVSTLPVALPLPRRSAFWWEQVPRGCTTTMECQGGARQVARCKAKGHLAENGCPVATDNNRACTGCSCLISCTVGP